MAIKSEKVRRVVSQRIGHFEFNNRKLDDVIATLLKFKEDNKDKGDLVFILSEGNVDEDGDWHSPTVSFSFQRLETDFEYNGRMALLQMAEETERKTYERLKKKFEG
jgi:hypothetical protein